MKYKNPLTLYQMKIFTTTKCSLRCKHCLNSTEKIPKSIASIDYIKKQINFVRKCGVRNIELGVLIGDTFEYPLNEFGEIIRYLESLKDVDVISISSSLLFLKPEHIKIINSTDKLKIQLSWYGKDDDEYEEITKFKKGYSRLLKNVELLNGITSNILLTVISMFPNKTDNNPLITILDEIKSKTNIKIVFDNQATVTNWKNMITDKIKLFKQNRRGACDYLFADMGIDENGDVLGCAWFDYGRLVKLGNIHKNTPKEVVDKHKKIVQQQEFGVFLGPCKNCTVYSCSGKKMDGSDG